MRRGWVRDLWPTLGFVYATAALYYTVDQQYYGAAAVNAVAILVLLDLNRSRR